MSVIRGVNLGQPFLLEFRGPRTLSDSSTAKSLKMSGGCWEMDLPCLRV